MLCHVAYFVRDVETQGRLWELYNPIALLLAKIRHLEEELFDLIELMWHTQALQASDHRDKLFALVGVVSHASSDFIDYSKSLA